jgi:hypothetical protein
MSLTSATNFFDGPFEAGAHEANIRGRGKTVHVFFNMYVQKPAVERGGGGRVTQPLIMHTLFPI